jgi:hypothetical protein
MSGFKNDQECEGSFQTEQSSHARKTGRTCREWHGKPQPMRVTIQYESNIPLKID